MSPVQYRSQVMAPRLVVGMWKEPGIVNPVDKCTSGISDEWNISHGEAVVAIINH